MGCHCLLQGIFPTRGSNPGLLHCRQTLYRLNHQGSLFVSPSFPPYILSTCLSVPTLLIFLFSCLHFFLFWPSLGLTRREDICFVSSCRYTWDILSGPHKGWALSGDSDECGRLPGPAWPLSSPTGWRQNLTRPPSHNSQFLQMVCRNICHDEKDAGCFYCESGFSKEMLRSHSYVVTVCDLEGVLNSIKFCCELVWFDHCLSRQIRLLTPKLASESKSWNHL